MEPGETFAETTVREVREETGIEATVEKLLAGSGHLRDAGSIPTPLAPEGQRPRSGSESRRWVGAPGKRPATE